MRFVYLAVLAGCLLGTLPLELVLHVRVYTRPLRLLLTLLPVVPVFVVWDLLAIRAGHWAYDPRQVTGVRIGALPLEELLFFLVIPVCAVLTLEAVRTVRGWPAGDEGPGEEPGRGPRQAGPGRPGTGRSQQGGDAGT